MFAPLGPVCLGYIDGDMGVWPDIKSDGIYEFFASLYPMFGSFVYKKFKYYIPQKVRYCKSSITGCKFILHPIVKNKSISSGSILYPTLIKYIKNGPIIYIIHIISYPKKKGRGGFGEFEGISMTVAKQSTKPMEK